MIYNEKITYLKSNIYHIAINFLRLLMILYIQKYMLQIKKNPYQRVS